MTKEEMMADERYHTCGRCKWENIPFICHACKWGEDVRKDLWSPKEDEVKTMNCDDCIFSDLSHWAEIAPGKAKPVLWCKKHRKFCEDITDCEWFINDRIEEDKDEE